MGLSQKESDLFLNSFKDKIVTPMQIDFMTEKSVFKIDSKNNRN